jgi:hypothetical protein
MAIHVVKAGESLSQIAKHYGVKFWANIYLAAENDELRHKRRSAAVLFPGDRLFIPSKESIARLETLAEVNHNLPKLFTQSTLDLCWQACAEMVFCWKIRTPTAEEDFKTRLGTDYNKPGGLNLSAQKAMLARVGMTWTAIDSVNGLNELVAARGPLYVVEINGQAHAQVLTGYNLLTVQWYLLDPLAKGMQIDFDTHGGATGGSIGAPTLANMSRKRKINSMVLDNTVFGYR